MTARELLAQATEAHRRGDISAAVELYREVLQLNPKEAEATHMLGVIAMQRGNAQLACQLIELSLTLAPQNALAWGNMALVQRSLGQAEDAEKSVRQSLSLGPDSAESWNLLALILMERGALDEVELCFQKAGALAPDNLGYACNYAGFLIDQCALLRANNVLSRFIVKDSGQLNLVRGNLLKAAGLTGRAISCYARAAQQLPAHLEVRVNEAVARLQSGDWQTGFRLYEERPDTSPHFGALPFWKGEQDAVVLFYEDQGLGDTIQFVRYLPFVAARCDGCVVALPTALHALMIHNFPDLQFCAADHQPATATHRFRLSSLPFLLESVPENFPVPARLMAPPENIAYWAENLPEKSTLSVGIVWAGNPKNKTDRRRSMPIEALQPLMAIKGCSFVSLQLEAVSTALAAQWPRLLDVSASLTDFAATAGLIEHLDLVVCVDTAVAHLAASMGKPVWLCVSMNPDWRWLLNRQDTCWYPSVKLYRQQAYFAWPEVMQRIAHDLAMHVAGNHTVLTASAPAADCANDVDHYALALD